MASKDKVNISVKEYIRRKALGLTGLIESDIDPRTRAERLTFVNNIDEIQKRKVREYNVWYTGDSDELLNFYTRANSIEFNYDPLYNRNKKSFFWAVSSTEGDIKRTHSGKPREVVDTLVNLIGVPKIGVGIPESELDMSIGEKLRTILDDNTFDRLLTQKARPMTLVEGWGAWKINWDTSFRDTPILLYYRAEAVDFIFKSNQIIAIIYQDYYQDEKGHNYILFETRRLSKCKCSIVGSDKFGQDVPCLIIEKDLYKINGESEILTPCKLTDLPELKDVQAKIVIENFNRFLGGANIYYEDNTGDCPGRSLYAGKVDIMDDIDQAMSQEANSVRRSTPTEVWDVNFLEKNKHTGLPQMPHSFDRKYVAFKGSRSGDGNVGATPVQITQPNINFGEYSGEVQALYLNFISGIMSPATVGIDIAKKDNAEAQREKEKVTIFTRNTIIEPERKTIRQICNDLLCGEELMRTGKLTCNKYDVYVRYDEFADSSLEAKSETVLGLWQSGFVSDKMAIDMMYGNSISSKQKKEELEFLQRQKEQAQQAQGDGMGLNPEDMGMFGELGAENAYNDAHENPDFSDMDVEGLV